MRNHLIAVVISMNVALGALAPAATAAPNAEELRKKAKEIDRSFAG